MTSPGTPRRRRPWGWLLLVVLVVVPLVEIYVLIQVGQVIGPWWTIALLVADSILGGWLIRREGGRAWRALTGALEAGRMPAKEIADGALILIGGTLMLAPGFVTDAVGILLILPFTRPLFRALLAGAVARRMLVGGAPGFGPGFGGPATAAGAGRRTWEPPDARHPGPGSRGPVVRGEVVDPPDSPGSRDSP